MELNVYLGGWTMLINPGVMILLSFALLADEYNTPDVYIALGIITYFIYWISVSYITINILGKIRNIFFKKKSKNAVP